MSGGPTAPVSIHGWSVFAHPVFLSQLSTLAQQVESLKQKDPAVYMKKNATKRLAAIIKLAFDVIPQDPTRPEYRQGHTLGDDYKHWLRAKFFQQYRLFFRYHLASKVIVLAWVNDEGTKRAESDAQSLDARHIVGGFSDGARATDSRRSGDEGFRDAGSAEERRVEVGCRSRQPSPIQASESPGPGYGGWKAE